MYNDIILYTGCSKWTNPNRSHAIHIADENREPICGKKYSNGASDIWNGEKEKVTCLKCKKLIQKHTR